MEPTSPNIIVIGGTIAGMMSALAAAERGARVTIVSRMPLLRSSDVKIKEGIAAVLHDACGDSVEQHARDLVRAGCDDQRARELCERAPTFVRFLARAGVLFNRTTEGHLEQIQTAGHTRPRTVRVDTSTGQHVVRVLEEQIRRYEAAERIERKEYLVPLASIIDDERRCRGVVVMQRTNHACNALKADAVIVASEGCGGLYGEARHTRRGLVVDDAYMTTVRGLFAAGATAGERYGDDELEGMTIAAHLVGGALAGESACAYVSGLTDRADELGSSLFERASDREEKNNKALMDRTEGENPYVIADELKEIIEQGREVSDEALQALAERAEKIALPDNSTWWNDSLIFTRDLQNEIALVLKGLKRFSTG